MQVKLTQSYVQSLKPDGKPHWIRDAVDNKLVLYLGRNGQKTWYVDYVKPNGKRTYYKIGPAPDIITVVIARNKTREFLARRTLGEDIAPKFNSNIRLREFIDDYYAQWVTDNRRSGVATLTMLRSAFAEFMNCPVADITPLQIEQWRVRYRKEQNAKAATINRYITTLKAALNWGIKHKIINLNPATGMESLRENDSSHKIRYLSEEERQRLDAALDSRETTIRAERANYNQWCKERKHPLLPDLSKIPFADHLKPMILISLNTGIRRKALFSLLWEDVDFKHKILTLRLAANKTEKDGSVNLNKIALDTFEKWHSQSTDTKNSALVFPSPRTGQIMDNCDSAWETLLKDADIQNFRWHDMRHDFASQLVMKGVDLNTVRELMGHSDLKMTLRYAHLAPSVKQAAVEKLG
jgi:integrase